jgi:hypothetical protein
MERSHTAKRVSAVRKVGWLGVASMLALALLAPSAGAVLAADAVAPSENDNACQNVVNGADSAFVWLTTSAAGLTVHWDQSEAAFGTDGLVVVRACVNGQGAWSQNDTNDGEELFPWSLFGLQASPCPVDGTLGGSVDGGTPFLNTQKSNGESCSTETTTTTQTTDTTTTGTTTTGTTTTDTTTTGTTTTGTTTTDTTTTQTTQTSTTTPSQSVLAETGTPSVPTGTPSVTLPPTDSIGGTLAPSSDSWRLFVIAMAALLATVLVMTPAKVTNRR